MASKYKPEYLEQAERLSMLGLTDHEMAKFFGVTRVTLCAWMKTHPELHAAIMAGKDLADARVVESLFKRAVGYSHRAQKVFQYMGSPVVVDFTETFPPDTMACMYWLNNRQRARWRRSPDPNGGEEDLPPTKVVFEVVDGRRPDRSRDPGEPE